MPLLELIKRKETERWCLNCDKCRFVFLALAPFFDKTDIINIFEKNLLDDSEQISGFEALIGYSGHKPFECVGEVEESVAAFYLLTKKTEWQDDKMIIRFKKLVLPGINNPDKLVSDAFTFSDRHMLPDDYEEKLRALTGSK